MGGVQTFDVICAGEALWNVTPPESAPRPAGRLRFVPGGGAVNAALCLAEAGIRVGLATAVEDDRFGRAFVERVASAGVDVGGVTLSQAHTGLVFVARIGGARQLVPFRREEQPVTVPEEWSAAVLLISGLSPVVAHAASLCKAARAARRRGTLVVIDVNARRRVWEGRDPRAMFMLVREADVVRCSAEDHHALGLDATAMRRAMRANAVFVGSNEAGNAWAAGPFGEVARGAGSKAPRVIGAGDIFTAAMCAQLARVEHAAEANADVWQGVLRRGQAACASSS